MKICQRLKDGLDGSRICRVGVKETEAQGNRLDGLKSCRGAIEKKPRNLDGLRKSQGSIEQKERSKEKLNGSACCRESIDSKAKRLDRKECVEVSVKKLSNLKKMSFSREEKHIKMNATSKLLK